jgi:hypothetical protein
MIVALHNLGGPVYQEREGRVCEETLLYKKKYIYFSGIMVI